MIKHKILSYFEGKSILSPYQFGFRKNFSTITALLAVLDDLVDGTDRQKNTHATLCDLSKAFDCVDVYILLHKLEHYGIRSKELNLFTSYLSDRKQYISFDGNDSEILSVSTGIPRDLALGPILFLVYINDLLANIDYSHCILFAADTTLLSRSSVVASGDHLGKANTWFSANKLKLNIDKINKITFTASKTTGIDESVNLLGIHLDTRLTWATRIDLNCSKLAQQAFLLRQLHPYVDNSF